MKIFISSCIFLAQTILIFAQDLVIQVTLTQDNLEWAKENPTGYIEEVSMNIEPKFIESFDKELKISVTKPINLEKIDKRYGDILKNFINLEFKGNDGTIFTDKLPNSLEIKIKIEKVPDDEKFNYANSIYYAIIKRLELEIYSKLPKFEIKVQTVVLPKIEFDWFLKNRERYFSRTLEMIWNGLKGMFKDYFDLENMDEVMESNDIDLVYADSIESNIRISYEYTNKEILPSKGIFVFILPDSSKLDQNGKIKYLIAVVENLRYNLRQIMDGAIQTAHLKFLIEAPNRSLEDIMKNIDGYTKELFEMSWKQIEKKLEKKFNGNLNEIISKTPNVNEETIKKYLNTVKITYIYGEKNIPVSITIEINLESLAGLSDNEKSKFLKAITQILKKNFTQNTEELIDGKKNSVQTFTTVTLPQKTLNYIIENEEEYYTEIKNLVSNSIYKYIKDNYGIEEKDINSAQVNQELAKLVQNKFEFKFLYENQKNSIPSHVFINFGAISQEEIKFGLAVYLETMQEVIINSLKEKIAEKIITEVKKASVEVKFTAVSVKDLENVEVAVKKLQEELWKAQAEKLFMEYNVKSENLESVSIDKKQLEEIRSLVTLQIKYGENKIPQEVQIINSFKKDVSTMSETERAILVKSIQSVYFEILASEIQNQLLVEEGVKVEFSKITVEQFKENKEAVLKEFQKTAWEAMFKSQFVSFGVTLNEVKSAKIDDLLVSRIVNDLNIKLEYKDQSNVPSGSSVMVQNLDISNLSKEEKIIYLKAIEIAMSKKLEMMLIQSINEGPIRKETVTLKETTVEKVEENISAYIEETRLILWESYMKILKEMFQIDLGELEKIEANSVTTTKIMEELKLNLKYRGDEKFVPSTIEIEFTFPMESFKMSKEEILVYLKSFKEAIYSKTQTVLTQSIRGSKSTSISVILPKMSREEIKSKETVTLEKVSNLVIGLYSENLYRDFGITENQVKNAKINEIFMKQAENFIEIELIYEDNEKFVPISVVVHNSHQFKNEEKTAEFLKSIQEVISKKIKTAYSKSIQEGREENKIKIEFAIKSEEEIRSDITKYINELILITTQLNTETFKIDSNKLETAEINHELAVKLDREIEIILTYTNEENFIPSGLIIINNHKVESNSSDEDKIKYLKTLNSVIASKMDIVIRSSIMKGKVSNMITSFDSSSLQEIQSNLKGYIEKMQKLVWEVNSESIKSLYKLDLSKIDSAKVDILMQNQLERDVSIKLQYTGTEKNVPSGMNLRIRYNDAFYNLLENMQAIFGKTLQTVVYKKMEEALTSSIRKGNFQNNFEILLPKITLEKVKENKEEYIKKITELLWVERLKELSEEYKVDSKKIDSAKVDDVLANTLENFVSIKLVYEGNEQNIPIRIKIMNNFVHNHSFWPESNKLIYLKTLQTVINRKTIGVITESILNGRVLPNMQVTFPERTKQSVDSKRQAYIDEITHLVFDFTSEIIMQEFGLSLEILDQIEKKNEVVENLKNDVVIKFEYKEGEKFIPSGATISRIKSYDTSEWSIEKKAEYAVALIEIINYKTQKQLEKSIVEGREKVDITIIFPELKKEWIFSNKQEYIAQIQSVVWKYVSNLLSKEYRINQVDVDRGQVSSSIIEKLMESTKLEFQYQGEETKIPIGLIIKLTDDYEASKQTLEANSSRLRNLKQVLEVKLKEMIELKVFEGIDTQTTPKNLEGKTSEPPEIIITPTTTEETSTESIVERFNSEIDVNFEEIKFEWALENVEEYVEKISKMILTSLYEDYKNEESFVSAQIDQELAKKLETNLKIILQTEETERTLPKGASFKLTYAESEKLLQENKAVFLKTLQSVVVKILSEMIDQNFKPYQSIVKIEVIGFNEDEAFKDSASFTRKLESIVIEKILSEIEMRLKVAQSSESGIVNEAYAATLQDSIKINYNYGTSKIPESIKIKLTWDQINDRWSDAGKQKFLFALLYSVKNKISEQFVNGIGSKVEDFSQKQFDVSTKEFARKVVTLKTRNFEWVEKNQAEYVKEVSRAMWMESSKVLEEKLGISISKLEKAPEPDVNYINSIKKFVETRYVFDKYGLVQDQTRSFPSSAHVEINWNLVEKNWSEEEKIKFALAVQKIINESTEQMVTESKSKANKNEIAIDETKQSAIVLPKYDIKIVMLDQNKYTEEYFKAIWEGLTKDLNNELKVKVEEIKEAEKIDDKYLAEITAAVMISTGTLEGLALPADMKININWNAIKLDSEESKTKFVQTLKHLMKSKVTSMISKEVSKVSKEESNLQNTEFAQTSIELSRMTWKSVNEDRKKFFEETYKALLQSTSEVLIKKLGSEISEVMSDTKTEAEFPEISSDVELVFNFETSDGRANRFPSGANLKIKWENLKEDWKKEDKIKFCNGVKFLIKQSLNELIENKVDEKSEKESAEEIEESESTAVVTIDLPKVSIRTIQDDQESYKKSMESAIMEKLLLRLGHEMKIDASQVSSKEVDEAYIKSLEKIFTTTFVSSSDPDQQAPVGTRITINLEEIKKMKSVEEKQKLINGARSLVKKTTEKTVSGIIEASKKDTIDFSNNQAFSKSVSLKKTTHAEVEANREEYEKSVNEELTKVLKQELDQRFGFEISKQIKESVSEADIKKFETALSITYNFERNSDKSERRIPFGATIKIEWKDVKSSMTMEEMVSYASALNAAIKKSTKEMVDQSLKKESEKESEEVKDEKSEENIVTIVNFPLVTKEEVKGNKEGYSKQLNALVWRQFGKELSKKIGMSVQSMLKRSLDSVDKQYAASIAQSIKINYQYSGQHFPSKANIIFDSKSIQKSWTREEKQKFIMASIYNVKENIDKMIAEHLEDPVEESDAAEHEVTLIERNVGAVKSSRESYSKEILTIMWKQISADLKKSFGTEITIDEKAKVEESYAASQKNIYKFDFTYDTAEYTKEKQLERKMPGKVKIKYSGIATRKTMSKEEKIKCANAIYSNTKASIEEMIDNVLKLLQADDEVKDEDVIEFSMGLPEFTPRYAKQYNSVYADRIEYLIWERLKEELFQKTQSYWSIIHGHLLTRPGHVQTNMKLTIDAKQKKMTFVLDLEKMKKESGGENNYLTGVKNGIRILVREQASDGKFTATTLVEIHVRDINNNSPIFENENYVISVKEDVSIGSPVIQVKATDADFGLNAQITYKLQKGAFEDFIIEENTGLIKVATKLDYDRRNTYNIEIVATDGGEPSLSGTSTLTVNVINTNDKLPYFVPTTQKAEIMEDAPVGTIVHTLVALDPDVNSSEALNFAATEPITALDKHGHQVLDREEYKDFFSVDKNTGKVTVTNPLLRDIAAILRITILVTDITAPTIQQGEGMLIIKINDVNDSPPQFIPPWTPQRPYYILELKEEQPVGTIVGTYNAFDEDSEIAQYAMIPKSEYFEINNGTGIVQIKKKIDYEQTKKLNFTVVAYDSGFPQLNTTAIVYVSVINVNDNDPIFEKEVYNVTAQENLPNGSHVVTVQATDGDAGDYGKITYSLTGEHSENFHINPETGEITIKNSGFLDREMISDTVIQVVASDGAPGNLKRSVSVPIYIEVLDVNDNAPKFDLPVYNVSVVENVRLNPPVPLLAIHATDGDVGINGNIHYKILSGNEKDKFLLGEDTGILYPHKSLIDGPHNYNLLVEARDGEGAGSLSDRAVINVDIQNVNEFKPSFIMPALPNATVEVTETAATENFLVMTVKATDKDFGENGRVTYHLKVDGEDVQNTNEFEIDINTGELRCRKALDREIESKYELVLVARDHGLPKWYETVTYLTILLVDMNDNRPEFPDTQTTNPYIFYVIENDSKDIRIGQVKALDRDEGKHAKVYYYILAGNENGAFILDKTDGSLYTNKSFDREEKAEYNLFILANNDPDFYFTEDDRNSLTFEEINHDSSIAKVKVVVKDINDNSPKFGQEIYYAAVNAMVNLNHFIINVTAIDPDEGSNGTITYYVKASNLYKYGSDKSSGSIIPSPFNISEFGEVKTATYLAENNQHRFVVDVIAREKAYPERESMAKVHIWVFEPSQLNRIILSRPVDEVIREREEIIAELSNATQSLVIIDEIRYHTDDLGRKNEDWSDMYILVIDPHTQTILPVPEVLKIIDSKYDFLKDYYAGFAIENVVPAFAMEKEESFDPALAALIALLIVLVVGIITFIIVCCCLRHWAISPNSMKKKDALIKKAIIDDLNTTENPLWIEQKLKIYEEQELTMQVFNEPEQNGLPRRNSEEFIPDDNTYATIQHPNRRGSVHMATLSMADDLADYATLSGAAHHSNNSTLRGSPNYYEAAMGFQGSTFQVPEPVSSSTEDFNTFNRSRFKHNLGHNDKQPEYVAELI